MHNGNCSRQNSQIIVIKTVLALILGEGRSDKIGSQVNFSRFINVGGIFQVTLV